LADSASQLNQPDAEKNIRKIRPWYFEVAQFQKALLFSANHFQQTVDELNAIVKTDPLTGFYNRRGMQMYVDTFEKQQTNFAILAINIDHFKTVNDQYGHAEGDRVLQHIAWQIQEQCRDQDICCRIGGEEFIVLLPNASYSLAQDKIEGIAQVTVSIGIAHWPTHHQNIDQTLQLADQHLYQAKADGRNCIR
jgi:GGDEF domain-containing protein